MTDQPTTFGPKTARRLLALANQPPPRPGVPGGGDPPGMMPPAPILFNNTSNEAVPAYGCMKVVGASLTSGRYLLQIQKPDSSGGPFLFNGPREVAAGGNGVAFTNVVRAAVVSGTTITAGQTYGPKLEWEVEPTGDPAILVFGEIDTNLAYGIASIQGDGNGIRMVIPDADVAPGNFTSCTVYAGQPPAPTGETIDEVWLDWMSGNEQISAGKQCLAYHEAGVWRFIGAECEDDDPQLALVGSGTFANRPAAGSTSFALYYATDTGALYGNNSGTWDELNAPAP